MDEDPAAGQRAGVLLGGKVKRSKTGRQQEEAGTWLCLGVKTKDRT